MIIPLYSPFVGNDEKKAISAVIDAKVLSRGKMVTAFQENFAEYMNKKFAIACNSGTSALHLAVRAQKISTGDEVITTPYSFVASTNCLLYERAKPIYVDIEKNSLNIDLKKIPEKINKKTKGILFVNLFGLPVYSKELINNLRSQKIAIIEDACESIGKPDKNFPIGYGDATIFGFYPNKQLTTAEGGMLTTDNPDIAEAVLSMTNQGFSSKKDWEKHVRLGYNYRMSEIHAALGIVQLKKIDEMLEKRQSLAHEYNKRLKEVDEIILPDNQIYKRSFFTYPIIFRTAQQRNNVEYQLNIKGIETNRAFTPLHYFNHIQNITNYQKGDFPITESIANRILNIPFFIGLKNSQIDLISTTIKKGMNND